MNKSAFIEYCEIQLKRCFIATKEAKPDIKLKHRTEGLMLAGEMLGVMSRAEAYELIEKTHYKVFGESTSERAKRKKSLIDLKQTSPDEYFDIPAIERRK